MLYFSTNITEEEIKAQIGQHKKTISKLENQRTLIISLVLLTAISIFLINLEMFNVKRNVSYKERVPP